MSVSARVTAPAANDTTRSDVSSASETEDLRLLVPSPYLPTTTVSPAPQELWLILSTHASEIYLRLLHGPSTSNLLESLTNDLSFMAFISNELKEAAEQLLLRDGLGEAGHEWGQSVCRPA